MASDQPVVQVTDVVKSYGGRRKVVPVLQHLNMTVHKGNIYGLLGPSGCGKTTLLRCILGRLKVEKGQIVTLGRIPGSRGHQVPGRYVGYMPQELALFMGFTIGETLRYFGHLMRMGSADISERIAFLIHFLNLPPKSRLITQLSGGQQRRTSFAVALMQQPPLLVLDEPTVGVDPLLRQRIWDHLIEIAQCGNTTIIITTHYIEEARQASMVGLMRNGRILAESNPEVLLQKYEKESLEDVFLKLCQADQTDDSEDDENYSSVPNKKKVKDIKASSEETESLLKDEVASNSGGTTDASLFNQDGEDNKTIRESKAACCGTTACRLEDFIPSWWTIFALVLKNLIIIKRNIGMLLFQFFVPSFQIIIFCLCIGQEPYNLKMAIVNNETISAPSVTSSEQLGDVFLSFISNKTIIQERYTSQKTALSAVETGEKWGVIGLGANFTQDLMMRYESSSKLDNKTISGGSVHLYLDTTNQQILFTIQTEIARAFTEFATVTLRKEYPVLKINPAVAKVPIIMEPPIYGTLNPSFTNFMAPGIIISITFFMATGLTAIAFVQDRKQGLLDRSFVAGVTAVEVVTAHVLTQFLVMIVQVGLLLVFIFAVFKVPFEGSLVLVIILSLFQGFTGMALGLVISSVCMEEVSAMQAALGTAYPNMILSGVIWPLEAMPVWMRYLAYCLPSTYAAESMRSILARGWGLTSSKVWPGFAMSIAWGWGMMIMAAIIFKVKR